MNESSNLADVNEPLVLADGTKINPMTGAVIKDAPSKRGMTEVPTDRAAVRAVTNARRKIGDLPVPPAQMNVLSVILSYTLMGLSDEDIATCIGIDEQRINAIRMTEVYNDLQEALVAQLIANDQDNVRSIVSEASRKAALRMTELMSSDSEDIQLAASKDILDRSGHRAVDIVEHRHKVEGGLTIKYVDRKDERRTLDGVAIPLNSGDN